MPVTPRDSQQDRAPLEGPTSRARRYAHCPSLNPPSRSSLAPPSVMGHRSSAPPEPCSGDRRRDGSHHDDRVPVVGRPRHPRRGHQAGVDNLLYEDVLTPAFLERRLAERASVADIAREVGCTSPAVRNALRRHDLAHLAPSDIRPPNPPVRLARGAPRALPRGTVPPGHRRAPGGESDQGPLRPQPLRPSPLQPPGSGKPTAPGPRLASSHWATAGPLTLRLEAGSRNMRVNGSPLPFRS